MNNALNNRLQDITITATPLGTAANGATLTRYDVTGAKGSVARSTRTYSHASAYLNDKGESVVWLHSRADLAVKGSSDANRIPSYQRIPGVIAISTSTPNTEEGTMPSTTTQDTPVEAATDTPVTEAPKPAKPAAKKTAANKTPAKAKTTPAKPKADKAPKADKPAFEWPTKPDALLLNYLKAHVTDAADAPNKGLPWINERGIVFIPPTQWRQYLVDEGIAVGKTQASEPIRDAGLVMRAAPIPGESRSMGFYQGPAPKGTEKLKRRQNQRASARSPLARLSAEQVAYMRKVLNGQSQTDLRDELVAMLPDA